MSKQLASAAVTGAPQTAFVNSFNDTSKVYTTQHDCNHECIQHRADTLYCMLDSTFTHTGHTNVTGHTSGHIHAQRNTLTRQQIIRKIYAHTHTHTHTHVRFCEKWGHPIGVMVFILYKLYVLLPYTYPIPKLSPHRRLCISTFPKKTSLCMIYKRFEKWGHGSMSWKVTFTL